MERFYNYLEILAVIYVNSLQCLDVLQPVNL